MRKIIEFLIVIALCVGITGCTSSKALTKEEAQTYALKEVDGKVEEYTQNLDDNPPNHMFSIIKDDKRYEVKVHSKTGEIISNELDADYVDKDKNNNQTATVITKEEAEKAAIDEVGGGTVERSELLNNGGKKEYKIQIYHNTKDYVVKVDAISKKIIDVEENEID